jgi:hypothetical protein
MFPNFRLMAASTLVSVMVLFFAFGVYASLRLSHEPLVRSSRAAPLQLVGFNVAMLPIAVLEPFANQHSGPAPAEGSSVLAYSGAQASQPQATPPVANAPDTHEDNAAVDEPAESSAVTKMPDNAGLEAAHDAKSPDEAIQESASAFEVLPQSATDNPTPVSPTDNPTPVSLPAATAGPQVSPVERTAVIETMPATIADEAPPDTKLPAKAKKKRVARHHLNRVQPRAIAQTSTPQATSYPAGIGGPFVSAPKH